MAGEWFVYGPVAVMVKYRRAIIRDDDTNEYPVELGEPILEPAGVLNRRAAIAHPFRPKQLVRLRNILQANGDYGAPAGIDAAEQMPADWRYPAGR